MAVCVSRHQGQHNLLTSNVGRYMTFAPEWLSGNTNLATSNFMYLWVYLFFFNMLWVVFPLWILYEAHSSINLAFARASGAIGREAKKNL